LGSQGRRPSGHQINGVHRHPAGEWQHGPQLDHPREETDWSMIVQLIEVTPDKSRLGDQPVDNPDLGPALAFRLRVAGKAEEMDLMR
jgi:hypothetical protein